MDLSSIVPVFAVAAFVLLLWRFNRLNILRENERAVAFRLGRVKKESRCVSLRGTCRPGTCATCRR